MSRTVCFLLVAAMTFAAFSLPVQAQQPDDFKARMLDAQLQLIEAKFELQMTELELTMAELAEDEATAEVDKIEQHLKILGNAAEARPLEVERDQAAIHLKMRATEVKMVRLRVGRAKSRLKAIEASQDQGEDKTTPVRLEYDDGSEVVVIRGSKQSVEKVRALLERAKKREQ